MIYFLDSLQTFFLLNFVVFFVFHPHLSLFVIVLFFSSLFGVFLIDLLLQTYSHFLLLLFHLSESFFISHSVFKLFLLLIMSRFCLLILHFFVHLFDDCVSQSSHEVLCSLLSCFYSIFSILLLLI